MEVSIDVINYQVIGSKDKAPHMIDWEVLGLSKDDEGLNSEHLSWSVNIDESEDEQIIKIESTIDIPCNAVHTHSIPPGTFYRYAGETTYKVSVKITTPIILAELALFHLGRYQVIIGMDSRSKSNGKIIHSMVIPSLGKLLLTAEALF